MRWGEHVRPMDRNRVAANIRRYFNEPEPRKNFSIEMTILVYLEPQNRIYEELQLNANRHKKGAR
jgi:hypothetical protein